MRWVPEEHRGVVLASQVTVTTKPAGYEAGRTTLTYPDRVVLATIEETDGPTAVPGGQPETAERFIQALAAHLSVDELDFYIHACQRVVSRAGSMAPDLLGRNLLGALYNMLQFPLISEVARLSAPVVDDILLGGGPSLSLCLEHTDGPINAVSFDASVPPERLSAACDALYSPMRYSLLDR